MKNAAYRDKDGKIFAYSSEAAKKDQRLALEVYIAKNDARLDRMESHQADMKVILNALSSAVNVVNEKMTALCNQWHEMLGTFGKVVTTNEEMTKACENNITEAMKFKLGMKIFAGIGTAVIAVGGLIVGVLELIHNLFKK